MRFTGVAVAALLAGAVYLRFTAISWGAPFVYHPDEHFVLHPALDIARTGDLNPHWFQYPSLLIYLEALLVALIEPFTRASLESSALVNGIGPWDALPEQWPFVYAGRLLVAATAVLSGLLLARVGERLHGAVTTGLLAGAFLMVTALHNESSHYLTTDVPAAALVIACMCATVTQPPRWWIAGILAGLAAGTKYTAGVAVLVPALAAIDFQAPRATLRRCLQVVLGSIGGFVASTPFALLDAPAFWEGLAAQRRNYFAWQQNQGNLQWYLEYLYDTGLGPALAVLAGAGLVYGIGRALLAPRRRDLGLQLAFILPPLLFVPWIASYPSRAVRNLIVILPFLCVAAANLLQRICTAVRPRWLGSALLVVCSLAVLGTGALAVVRFNQRLLLPDNRTVALEWIRSHVPRGVRIAREEYTPQVPTAEYTVDYTYSLAQKRYAQYLAERAEILVASSDVYGRVIDPPYILGAAGPQVYKILFGLPLLQEFPQQPFSSGPTVRIYRVPLSKE